MYLDRACCCKYRVHGDIIGRYASLSESFPRSVFLCIPAFENISCFRRRCHSFCGDSLSGFHICHFHAGDILTVIFYCITALFSQVQVVPHRLSFADQSRRAVFCIDLCQICIQRARRYSYRRDCSLGNSGKCSRCYGRRSHSFHHHAGSCFISLSCLSELDIFNRLQCRRESQAFQAVCIIEGILFQCFYCFQCDIRQSGTFIERAHSDRLSFRQGNFLQPAKSVKCIVPYFGCIRQVYDFYRITYDSALLNLRHTFQVHFSQFSLAASCCLRRKVQYRTVRSQYGCRIAVFSVQDEVFTQMHREFFQVRYLCKICQIVLCDLPGYQFDARHIGYCHLAVLDRIFQAGTVHADAIYQNFDHIRQIFFVNRINIHISCNHGIRSHSFSGSVFTGIPFFEYITLFFRCSRQFFSDRLTFLHFQFCCGSVFLMDLYGTGCCKYRVYRQISGRYTSLSESFPRSVFLCIPAFENISCFRRRCHSFCGDSLSGFHICHFHAGDILTVIFYCITALFSQVQVVPHRLSFADQSRRAVFCIDLCQICIQRARRYSYRRDCSLGNSGKCSRCYGRRSHSFHHHAGSCFISLSCLSELDIFNRLQCRRESQAFQAVCIIEGILFQCFYCFQCDIRQSGTFIERAHSDRLSFRQGNFLQPAKSVKCIVPYFGCIRQVYDFYRITYDSALLNLRHTFQVHFSQFSLAASCCLRRKVQYRTVRSQYGCRIAVFSVQDEVFTQMHREFFQVRYLCKICQIVLCDLPGYQFDARHIGYCHLAVLDRIFQAGTVHADAIYQNFDHIRQILFPLRVQIDFFINYRLSGYFVTGSVFFRVPAGEEIPLFRRCCRQIVSNCLTFFHLDRRHGAVLLVNVYIGHFGIDWIYRQIFRHRASHAE